LTERLALFLIAGEPSGDRLGGALLAGLRQLCGDELRVAGIAGPEMTAGGLESLFPMDELSVMGLAEVLPRAPALLRRIRETADAVVRMRPDALVTIDSPDFCLRVARRARAVLPDLRVIHYVAPSVWAWRPGRAAKMAKVVDHVLALLPFEPPLMQAAGMSCDFVGHPVAAEPRAEPAAVAALRAEIGAAPDQPLLCVLPGSRRGEVARLAPVFREVVARLRRDSPGLAVAVPAAGPVAAELAALMPPDAEGWPAILDPRPLSGPEAEARKRAAFAASAVALAASGTVSLELAAAGTPMVIAYDASPLTAFLVRRMVRIDTATLVNLVTGTRAIPEFLFDRCRPEPIAAEVARLLRDPEAAGRQRAVEDRAMDLLGRGGEPPGLRAARSVLRVVERPRGDRAASA
jgi:lipid-A-disaccharide synthase